MIYSSFSALCITSAWVEAACKKKKQMACLPGVRLWGWYFDICQVMCVYLSPWKGDMLLRTLGTLTYAKRYILAATPLSPQFLSPTHSIGVVVSVSIVFLSNQAFLSNSLEFQVWYASVGAGWQVPVPCPLYTWIFLFEILPIISHSIISVKQFARKHNMTKKMKLRVKLEVTDHHKMLSENQEMK